MLRCEIAHWRVKDVENVETNVTTRLKKRTSNKFVKWTQLLNQEGNNYVCLHLLRNGITVTESLENDFNIILV